MSQELVKKECEMWYGRGKNIRYERRENRIGYKAGALKVGMRYSYVESCEYIAMFDADFQPAPDFLMRTVPFLVHNPSIALVQSRWKFGTSRRLEVRVPRRRQGDSSDGGTVQVKRRVHALTVVLYRLTVSSRAPSKLTGISSIVGLAAPRISRPSISLQGVSMSMKLYVIYNFFVARRIVSHFVTFSFYCVVIPLSVFFPEVTIPRWGLMYVPTAITLINAAGTPSSFHLVIFWVLFENVMSLHRCKAVLIGLLETGRVNEWIVTEKLGDTLKSKSDACATKRFRFKIKER
ncbi:hypothetical protein BHE74_00032768 [Ensete ventricosum]|nr:hypothetical protein BHE74_00032768 [Ensete ventricosum]